MMSKLPAYSAGEFRHPVTVLRVVEVPDGSGGFTKSWGRKGSMFCKIDEKNSSEPYGDATSGRIRTFKSWEFVTWHGTDVVETDKLEYNGLEFNIKDVTNVGLLNKWMKIRAEAGVEQ
jgi:head-tail adaptor